MKWFEKFIKFLGGTAQKLKGTKRRQFMAQAVDLLGRGGQRKAERLLGWNRGTIRKGAHEVRSGIICLDAFNMRGRKPIEAQLPKLLEDMKDIVERQSQTDPTFETTRIYRRITVKEVVRQLIEQKKYLPQSLPHHETIRNKLNQLGFAPNKVMKTKPKKKIKETDEIFQWVHQTNREADETHDELRISMDVKATVKIGPFSRGGKTRVKREAADHDFDVKKKLLPVGILLPETNETFFYFVESKVTADCLVDVLTKFWSDNKERFPGIKRLVINQDNGPECNSRRTQFIKRIIEFCDKSQIDARLAYYPPYHSKYNPIERCFGVLENEWNGDILDSVKAVLGHAAAMTWNGIHPTGTSATFFDGGTDRPVIR